ALGGDRRQLTLVRFGRLLVDDLEIGGLAAHPGTVIDDLAVDFSEGEVDLHHDVASEPLNADLSQSPDPHRGGLDFDVYRTELDVAVHHDHEERRARIGE